MEGFEDFNEGGTSVAAGAGPGRGRVLVVDDSTMLLNFVKEMLRDANYAVTTATTGAAGVAAAKAERPALILLDYVLPDMRGDETLRRLSADPDTAQIRVIYMSGMGSDLRPDSPNVIGFLNKPFTSDLLIKTVETHMPNPEDNAPHPHQPAEIPPDEMPTTRMNPPSFETTEPAAFAEEPGDAAETSVVEDGEEMAHGTGVGESFAEAPVEPGQQQPASEEWWSDPQPQPPWSEPAEGATDVLAEPTPEETASEDLPNESVTGGAFFCGDTRFFSLTWALRSIEKERLSGTLRSFWAHEPVDLLARNGEIVLVTTRDPEMYCSDSPITIVNVDPDRVAAAREEQRAAGSPMFLTLAREHLILREPALELVQHYGQKLFAQLWAAKRVRFMFEQGETLPDYANEIAAEPDIDNWMLATLRLVQLTDLGSQANYDQSSIPAYTKDGFERVQRLRLTVAEAQFASQFNGSRSIQQIAKNLRLDVKFARLTLFRFIALEIVECWPAQTAAKPERKGFLQRLGIGD